MNRCPVSQAEIDNDQPYCKFNRDALEEHDRATENLRQERREFVENLIKHGYAYCGSGINRKSYYLTEAIEMIADKAFWDTIVETKIDGEIKSLSIEDLYEHYSSYDDIADIYMCGNLPQWHAEIHKQVVLLADMALGEV